MEKTFKVTISRTDTFTVTAQDASEAEDIAFNMWFENGGIYSVEVE